MLFRRVRPAGRRSTRRGGLRHLHHDALRQRQCPAPVVSCDERRLRPARPPFAGHAGPGIDMVRKDPGLVGRLKAKGLRIAVARYNGATLVG